MSGGSFDYNCFKISEFADDLDLKIRMNGKLDKHGWGDDFSKDTLALLTTSHQIINTAAKLAKEIGWLYSGDSGEETFSDAVGKIMAGL